MGAYLEFAQVYDEFMDNVDYNEWCSFAIKLLKKNGMENCNLVEIGCGTGSATMLFAKAGYSMTGIDISQEMLGTDEDIISKDIENEVERKLLYKAIEKLNNREKIIVQMRYGLNNINGDEMTQKEVAEKMGISQSYISRLEKRIMGKLRKEMLRQTSCA